MKKILKLLASVYYGSKIPQISNKNSKEYLRGLMYIPKKPLFMFVNFFGQKSF